MDKKRAQELISKIQKNIEKKNTQPTDEHILTVKLREPKEPEAVVKKLGEVQNALVKAFDEVKVTYEKMDFNPKVEVKAPNVTLNAPDTVKVDKPGWLNELKPEKMPDLGPIATTLEKISSFKLPTGPENPIPVRLSDGKAYYNALQAMFGGGGSSSSSFQRLDGQIEKARLTNSNYLIVVNADGTAIGGGGGGSGTAAYSDSGGVDKKGLVDADRHVQVDVLTAPVTAVTGTFWQATQPVSGTITANIGTVATLATAANQLANNHNVVVTSAPTTAVTNAGITSIDGKTPALGQALAAASVPIVLTAAQVTTLTPPAAITGFATSAKQDTLLTELQLKADLTETQPVSLASVPSHAVTNAGTFATQATLQTGSAAIGKLAANSGIDIGDVDVTSIVAGTGAANLGKAEDAAHVTGDTGVAIFAVRQDTLAALAGTTGDYIPLSTDSSGRLYEISRPDNYAVDDSVMPATPNTFPVSGEYRATATTYADGDVTVLQADVNGNAKITQATAIAGEDLTNNVLKVEQRSSYTNLTVDTAVKSAPGRLFGIFVASASATPTIKIWDNTSAATTVLINTFTPVAATYYQFPGVEFGVGLYVDVGGTVDITVFYK